MELLNRIISTNKNKSNLRKYLQKNEHFIFVIPSLTIMVLLSIIPTLFLLIVSFTNYQLGWDLSQAKFVGLENFSRLFSNDDPDFWFSVFISLYFMILASGIELIIGISIALLLHSLEFKLKPLVLGVLLIPIVMTPSIAAQMWKLMLNAEYGIINYMLDILFNKKIIWLSENMAIYSVLLVDVWQNTPFITLVIYSGLRSLPDSPYESAMMDGANQLQILFEITFPLIKKLILLVLLFRSIDALKLFDTVFVLTQGGPGRATELLSMHIYRMLNAQNGFVGRAGALSLILLFLVSVISRFLIKQQKLDPEN